MGLVIEQLRSALAGPFSVAVAPGTCLAVTGPSGSGKSLLLRMIADLDPSEGRVTLDGEDRDAMPADAWRRKVALVPARSGWWADNVEDHFVAGDRHQDACDGGTRADLVRALGLGDALFQRSIDNASTGERQRLAILRALLLRPRVLLLDEPTASLDPASTLLMETLLRERLDHGLILVIVTHDLAQAEKLGDSRLTMRAGAPVSG